MASVAEAKELISEMCRNFYQQGWVSGTGGGMSIKVPGSEGAPDRIVMAPSGVQKERMRPEDMFVLDNQGNVVETPEPRGPPYKAPKLSECSPLFMAAFEMRGAGAVLHSHSMNVMLATVLDQSATEFNVTHLEMIKGIAGHGFFSNCTVPIIENTARECELTGRLREAIAQYPETNAVLVRRHGVYVWGKDWVQAKTQAECYEYLFEAAVRLRTLGIDAARAPGPPPVVAAPANGVNGHAVLENGERSGKRQKAAGTGALPVAIVLDIEGTVAPISYVTEVLFPYAAARLRSHLESTYQSRETQDDIDLLWKLGHADQLAGSATAVALPLASAGREAIIDAAVASCEAQMAVDRKTTALKSLQGHIWRSGFANGELKAELYRDVPDSLVQWRAAGIKTYIYSSGSREAQKNLFGHTTAGDLRPYLYGFFDTTSGLKVEAGSYTEIALALGVDQPADILFATDNIAEAEAAAAAGWRVALTVRPGNKPLPSEHKFRVIETMEALLH